ncbi:MAG: ABC transporter ATP-binding protein/permease [Armatimonadetes bacterium]|nr:ABC transporter ATP-binding protein/permease [Armatimonadota bacterium]MDW8026816.1 ABC transporter ATP-binding protein [Armatimonadota bacterium]
MRQTDAFWRLLIFFRPYWKRVIAFVLLIGAAEGLRFYLIWLTQDLLKPLIQSGIRVGESDWLINAVQNTLNWIFADASHRLTFLASVCIVSGWVAILRAAFSFAHTFLANNIAQKVVLDLRRRLYSHLQLMPPSFFEHERTGQLLARVVNDVATLQSLVTIGIEELVSAPILIIGSLVMMVVISPPLTIIALILLPLIGWLMWRLGRKLRKASYDIQVALGNLTVLLRESFSAIKLVQAFGAEEQALNQFDQRNRQVYQHALRAIRLRTMLSPSVELIGTLGVVAGVFTGGMLVIQGWLHPNGLLAFMICFYTLASSTRKLTQIQAVREQVAGSAERIFQVLDVQPQITDEPDAVDLPEVRGEIVFENVRFRYPSGDEVLKGVSFKIRTGEKVAIVGPSGVGKTTIVMLLMRFHDPTAGRILLDGHDLRKIRLRSLRQHMGLVLQDIFVIDGTISENITLGNPDATEDEIVEAAKLANAHEFIERLPNGYETWVGEGGAFLSVGQRQRIALARALLKKPAILILDEVTSHLDAESEAAVQQAVERAMQGRTVIIIAHRLSTVRNADRILVLQDGQIVEEGSHEELVAADTYYRRLYELQQ